MKSRTAYVLKTSSRGELSLSCAKLGMMRLGWTPWPTIPHTHCQPSNPTHATPITRLSPANARHRVGKRRHMRHTGPACSRWTRRRTAERRSARVGTEQLRAVAPKGATHSLTRAAARMREAPFMTARGGVYEDGGGARIAHG